MKKIFNILSLFFISFMFYDTVNAAVPDLKSIACNYNLTTVDNRSLGKAQIMIRNYNNGAGNPEFIYYHEAAEGGQLIKYNGPTHDYPTGDYGFLLRFMTTDSKAFLKNYETLKRCPDIFVNSLDTSIDVESYALYPDQGNFKKISASSTLLSSDNSSWHTPEEFYKDSGVEVPDDKTCTYTADFDLFDVKAPVIFTKTYDPATGNPTYQVSVNNNSLPISSLDQEISINIGLGTPASLRVKPEHLKKIFDSEKCPDPVSEVCHYLDANLATEGIYYFSTDINECKEDGVAGRYENGAGSNDGQGGTLQDIIQIGFGDKDMKCEEFLGKAMTDIIATVLVALKIGGLIICMVKMMLSLIPAIVSKDPAALNKAISTCAILLVICAVILLIDVFINFIGNLFGFDLTCFTS